MKEAAAGLIVLEVMRTKGDGSKMTLTEDELHEAIMEALNLVVGSPDTYGRFTVQVQRRSTCDGDVARVGS